MDNTQVKLTPFLMDECSELSHAMEQKYALYLEGRAFSVECTHNENDVYVMVILKNSDETYYYPVEARIKYKEEEMSCEDGAHFLIDYIDSYFEEYLSEDDELLLCIDWVSHQYDAVQFQIKGQIFNRKVEQMANELLGDYFEHPGEL